MRWVLRATLVLFPACFHPVYDHPACGPGGACPSGMSCSAALVCESGSSASPPDVVADAHATDAVAPDASLCGDGQAEASLGEVCDDGNASACGTCSADCTTITSAAATGKIVAVSAVGHILDGDNFTLNDGFKQNTFGGETRPGLVFGGSHRGRDPAERPRPGLVFGGSHRGRLPDQGRTSSGFRTCLADIRPLGALTLRDRVAVGWPGS
jgi:cysteine-rich repeat protein